MALNLGDLLELSILTSLMDASISLNKLIESSEMWHELNGRGDLKRQMSAVMRRMMDDGRLLVTDISNPEQPVELVGVEAQMTLERAASGLRAVDHVVVSTTESGKATYMKLARSYYNS
jgi:hypothetical protein